MKKMREEYLALHNEDGVGEPVQRLIDWLGAHLIYKDYPAAQTITGESSTPPRLDNILVPTVVEIGDLQTIVHLAAIHNAADIAELNEPLKILNLDEDPALRAFLLLPNVNAMNQMIMEEFETSYVRNWPTMEDALTALADLDEREQEILEFATERRLYFDYLISDYEVLRQEAEGAYDFVELDGRIYVFYK